MACSKCVVIVMPLLDLMYSHYILYIHKLMFLCSLLLSTASHISVWFITVNANFIDIHKEEETLFYA